MTWSLKFSTLILLALFCLQLAFACGNDSTTCGEHGFCSPENVCICNEGYFGQDCSVQGTQLLMNGGVQRGITVNEWTFFYFLVSDFEDMVRNSEEDIHGISIQINNPDRASFRTTVKFQELDDYSLPSGSRGHRDEHETRNEEEEHETRNEEEEEEEEEEEHETRSEEEEEGRDGRDPWDGRGPRDDHDNDKSDDEGPRDDRGPRGDRGPRDDSDHDENQGPRDGRNTKSEGHERGERGEKDEWHERDGRGGRGRRTKQRTLQTVETRWIRLSALQENSGKRMLFGIHSKETEDFSLQAFYRNSDDRDGRDRSDDEEERDGDDRGHNWGGRDRDDSDDSDDDRDYAYGGRESRGTSQSVAILLASVCGALILTGLTVSLVCYRKRLRLQSATEARRGQFIVPNYEQQTGFRTIQMFAKIPSATEEKGSPNLFVQGRYSDLQNTFEQKACCICIERFEHNPTCVQLYCQHIFHIDCIESWFKKHSTCPDCRQPMTAEAMKLHFEMKNAKEITTMDEQIEPEFDLL